tara:strand:+ start:213 stop:815 length:603 start_codon:yes stop_codon:yes gene_type:complete
MLILGAGGHAIEVLDALLEKKIEKGVIFFDDTIKENGQVLGKFIVYNNMEDVVDCDFCLGVGGVEVRKMLSSKGLQAGKRWKGVRANNIVVGKHNSSIHTTVDLMMNVTISSVVSIGKGTLVNRGVNIHHEVNIGDFCELASNCCLLGNVELADEVFIGAGAIVLPKVKIGKGAVIGAGAIVVNDVKANTTVVGNPARLI